MVLMMNFLSWEKKKKLPLLPWDSPALKTESLFFSVLKLSFMQLVSISSNDLKKKKASGAYSMTLTSSLMIRYSSSF
jgi:hypothetical protein